ncbi:MAG: TonB-dependent receptor [Chloroherpetonaceae bacterium]
MNNKIKYAISLFLFLFFAYKSSAADNFSLTGAVFDQSTNEAIIGATVQLERTSYGTYTNKLGEYTLRSIPKGNYVIIASAVGYETQKQPIELISDTTLTFNLAPKVFKTNEIIITANKQFQSIQEISNSAFVIEQKSFNTTNQFNFEEILKTVPGVEVYKENVSIRGSDGFDFGIGSRTLMMLDGIPLMSGDNGDLKFNIIPFSDIDRIEVVKGAGSALYGTSAIGGVINLISAEPSEQGEFNFDSFFGLYTKPTYKSWEFSSSPTNKYGIQAAYGKKIGSLGMIVSGNYLRDESYRLYDDSYAYSGFTELSYDFTSASKLKIYGLFSLSDNADWVYWNSLDSATRPPTSTNLDSRFISSKSLIAANYNHIFSENIFLNFKTSAFFTHFENNYSSSNPDYRQSDALSLFNELQLTNHLSDWLLLTSGVAFTSNTIDASMYGNQLQQIYSGYSQAEFAYLKNLIITAGFRLDYETGRNFDDNFEISPKFGFNYKLLDNWRLRSSIGKGFRAPAIAERFATLSYQGFRVKENLKLKPEDSWSFEIGTNYTNYTILPFEIDLSLFDNEFYNLIEPAFTDQAFSTIEFQNLTRARIQGIDLMLRAQLLPSLGLQTSLTYMDPRDLTLNAVLKFRAKLLSISSIYFKSNNYEIRLNYHYSSKVVEIDEKAAFQVKDADARVPIHIVDLFLTYNLQNVMGRNLAVSLNCYNLLNYYYTYMIGNLGATRLIGISLSLGI